MMFCKNCGHELKDDDKYCPNCGAKISEDKIEIDPAPVYDNYEEVKRVTFKEAISGLFKKFMLFKGTESRREFNLSFLFIILIEYAIGIIVGVSIASSLLGSMPTDSTLLNEWIQNYEVTLLTSPLFVAITSISSVLVCALLIAPLYRRVNDIFGSTSIATASSVIYGLNMILNSSIVSSYIRKITALNALTTAINFLSFVIIILAIFMKPRAAK